MGQLAVAAGGAPSVAVDTVDEKFEFRLDNMKAKLDQIRNNISGSAGGQQKSTSVAQANSNIHHVQR